MATATQIMQSSALTTHTQPSATTAPVHEHACLFTHDVRRKQKRWQDGRLKYHTFNRRVMVHDERGNFVGDTYWREDYDLADGDNLELERGGIIIQVGECVGSRDQDLSDLIDKRAQEKAQRQAAAAARRPPAATVATLHGVKPLPLPQKHLHDVIGTPSGHHGRAVLPKESPYEERRQRQPPPQSGDTRPAKRQRREISPPSKSGYAQNLFGATLTLSGRPSSQAPAHSRSSRQILLQANDAQLSTNTFARLHSSIRPESPSCINPTILDNPGKSPTPQKQRPRFMPDQQKERIGACSVLHSQSTNHHSRKCRGIDESLEQQDLRTGQPRDSPAFGGSKKIQDQKRSGAGNDCIQGHKHRDLNIIDLTEDRAETPKPSVHGEPRTELRIKPRKKRGLLVISERDTVSGSSKSELANTGPDGHECPLSPKVHPINISSDQEGEKPKSTDTQHNWTNFPQKAREIVPRGKKMNAENNDQEGTHGDHPSSFLANTRHLEDTGFDEMQSPDRSNPESWKGTKLRTAIEQGDIYTTETCAIERRSLRSVKRPPNEDTLSTRGIDKDRGHLCSTRKEDNVTIDEMPAPRLAKLGRKSIKSKEVIGIVFEDEPDPVVSVKQNEHTQEPPLEFQPGRDTGKHQPQSDSKVCDGFVMTEGRPDTEPRSSRKRSLARQRQKSWNPNLSNNEASRIIQTEGASSTMTTTTTKQPNPIANPATRGKKAAKPSDAAGQMPICPLPAESVESSSLYQNLRKTNVQKNLDTRSASPMPGFSRANGGPWSREAHDLFDFKRPS